MAFSTPSIAAEDPVVDVAVTNLVLNKRVVGYYQPMRLNITLHNQGDEEVTVDITIFVNAARITGISNVTLASGESLTVGITRRALVEKGNYTISANTTLLLGETDVDDNTCLGGWLFVTLIGDVDGNRHIDIFDVVRVAVAYGASSWRDPRYDPYCDIDENGAVNLFDLVHVAGPYGWFW